jgi:hypothetical protein
MRFQLSNMSHIDVDFRFFSYPIHPCNILQITFSVDVHVVSSLFTPVPLGHIGESEKVLTVKKGDIIYKIFPVFSKINTRCAWMTHSWSRNMSLDHSTRKILLYIWWYSFHLYLHLTLLWTHVHAYTVESLNAIDSISLQVKLHLSAVDKSLHLNDTCFLFHILKYGYGNGRG